MWIFRIIVFIEFLRDHRVCVCVCISLSSGHIFTIGKNTVFTNVSFYLFPYLRVKSNL